MDSSSGRKDADDARPVETPRVDCSELAGEPGLDSDDPVRGPGVDWTPRGGVMSNEERKGEQKIRGRFWACRR